MCRLPLRLWAVLSLLLGIVSSGAEPSTVPPSIRVAHYNVQNYLVMDRFLKDEKRNVEDAPKPEKSIAALIRMIVEVNPDILHVAERWDRPNSSRIFAAG